MLIEAKDDGSCGDNWSFKSCKALVESSSPTNQHQTFYRPDALPVAQPTVSKHWRENITFHGLTYTKFTWGLPTLSLTTNSSWLPVGRLTCLSSALWCQYPNYARTTHYSVKFSQNSGDGSMWPTEETVRSWNQSGSHYVSVMGWLGLQLGGGQTCHNCCQCDNFVGLWLHGLQGC